MKISSGFNFDPHFQRSNHCQPCPRPCRRPSCSRRRFPCHSPRSPLTFDEQASRIDRRFVHSTKKARQAFVRVVHSRCRHQPSWAMQNLLSPWTRIVLSDVSSGCSSSRWEISTWFDGVGCWTSHVQSVSSRDRCSNCRNRSGPLTHF